MMIIGPNAAIVVSVPLFGKLKIPLSVFQKYTKTL